MSTAGLFTFILCLLHWTNMQIFGLLFNIPEPVDPFFGRGLLLENLHNTILDLNREVQDAQKLAENPPVPSFHIIGLHGISGIGKRQLVLKYIQLLRMQMSADDPAVSSAVPQFKHFIWLNAEDDHRLQNSFLTLYAQEELQIPDIDRQSQPFDINQIVTETYQKLCQDQKLSLIIFSLDLQETTKNFNVSSFLLPFLPTSKLKCPSPTILVLLTTPSESTPELLSKMGVDPDFIPNQLEIPRMSEADNVVFVLQRLRNRLESSEQNQKDAKSLGELLKGIPLAIHQALAYIEEEDSQYYKTVEIQEYVQSYLKLQHQIMEKTKIPEIEGEKLESEVNQESNNIYCPTFLTSNLTRTKLHDTEEGKEALSILEILAFLPGENLRVKSVQGLLDENSDSTKILKGLSTLQKFGLILTQKNGENLIEFVEMHRDTQKIIQQHLNETGRIQGHLDVLLGRCLTFWEKFDESQSHEQFFGIFDETVRNIEKFAGKDLNFRISEVKAKMAMNLRKACRSRAATLITEVFSKLKNNRDFETDIGNRNRISAIFYEPPEFSVDIQDLAIEILGENHPFNLELLQTLADYWIENRNLDKALQNLMRIEQIIEDSPLKNVSLMLDTIFKMAEIYIETGKNEDAIFALINLYEKEKANKNVVSSNRKTRHLNAIYSFSRNLSNQGKFEMSLELLNQLYALQALQPKIKSKSDIENQNPSPQNPAVLSTLHHIAMIKFHQRKYQEALETFTKVTKERIKSLGRNHLDTLRSIEGQAGALFRLHRYDESENLYSQVHEVRTRVKKDKTAEDLLETSSTQYNLARVRIHQGRGQEAQEKGRERLLDALKLFQDSLEIRLENYGPNHLETLASLEQVAILNVTTGTDNEATLALETMHQIYEQKKTEFGEEDERALATLTGIALSLLIINHKPSLDYLPQGDTAIFDVLKKIYSTRGNSKNLKGLNLLWDFERTDMLNTFAHILLTLQGKGKGGIQGKVRALDMLTSVHFLQEKGLGPNDPETLTTLGHKIQLMILQGSSDEGLKLATDLIQKNKDKKKKELKKKGKDIKPSQLKKMDLATIGSMELLLQFYLEAPQLYYSEAVNLLKEIHELKKSTFGENSVDTLATLNRLARLYGQHADWPKSETIFGDVYKIRKRTLGPDDLETLEALHNFAEARFKQNKVDDAFPLFKQLYDTHKKISGDYHEQTLLSLQKMAEIREKQGRDKDDKQKTKEALKFYNSVYKKRVKYLGDDHNDTLHVISLLIRLHSAPPLENNIEALKLLKKVYESQKKALGSNHVDTLSTLKKMSDLFITTKKYEKAVKLLKRIFKAKKDSFGPIHRETVAAQEELANLHYTMGHMDDAEDAFLQLYELKKSNPKKWGPDHPDTLKALEKLAALAKEIKNYGESLDLHKQVWAGRKRSLGEEHEDTIKTTEELANLYLGFGDEEESEKLRKVVYNIRVKILGKENAVTIEAEKNLAMVYLEQGGSKERKEKGLKLLENVLKGQKKVLGPEHPDTQGTDQTIKFVKEQLGLNKKDKEEL